MTVKGDDMRRRILAAIKDSIEQSGFQPTRRELATWLGLKSPSGIQHHIDVLEEAGVITKDKKGRVFFNGTAGQDGQGE
jgi:SOS-response transcriptional repressor LexA